MATSCITFARTALYNHPSFWGQGDDVEVIDEPRLISTENAIYNSLAAQITPFVTNIEEATVNCANLDPANFELEIDQNTSNNGDQPCNLKRLYAASNSTSGFRWSDRRSAYLNHPRLADRSERLAHQPDIEHAEAIINQRLLLSRLESVAPRSVSRGNEQYQAIALALWGSASYHALLRKLAVRYMRRNPEEYAVFLGDDFQPYLENMSQPGVLGDELTLRAIADHFGIAITLVVPDEHTWCMRYAPKRTTSRREVYLAVISPESYRVIRKQTAITTLKQTITHSIDVRVGHDFRKKISGELSDEPVIGRRGSGH